MTDFFTKPNGFKRWRLAIWKVTNGTLKAGLTSLIAATSAVDWSHLSTQEKLIIYAAALLAMQNFLDGFLDKTLADLDRSSADATKAGPFPTP